MTLKLSPKTILNETTLSIVYSYNHDIEAFSETILNETALSIVYSYDHDTKAFSKTILNETTLSIVYSSMIMTFDWELPKS
jgi:hypothetical protein